MDFEKIRKLCQSNEVRIDNYKHHKRNPPFYYDSLRHAFSAYFNTFHTKNATYNYYAEGLYDRNVTILRCQLLDDDNTLLTIVSFERFFELFLKDLLKRVNVQLIYQSRERNIAIDNLINQIEEKRFVPKKFGKKALTIPFRETIDRFYSLVDIIKSNSCDNGILKKFSRLIRKYSFLDSEDYKVTLKLLNWYRDRVLHNGSRLPSLWLLDYIVTQRIVPIVNDIVRKEDKKIGELYYLKTVTGISIIDRLNDICFEFNDLKKEKKVEDIFHLLLNIGHLKELGRANINMNLFVRNNIQAGYEYNYKDPIGRGIRFAQAEKVGHENFKEIKKCPCCGEESLVLYLQEIDDIFNDNEKVKIEWVKCYVCDYHVRYNVGDPIFFNLSDEKIFEN